MKACGSFLVIVLCYATANAEQPRFSPEARPVLEQITQAYDLNGKRMPSGKFDETVLAKAAQSSDSNLKVVAQHLPELHLISTLNKKSRENLPQEYLSFLTKISTRLLVSAIEPDDKKSVERSIEVLEDSFSETQSAVNKAWATAYIGNGLGNSLKQQLRDLARASRPGEIENRSIVSVKLGTGVRLGTVMIKNNTPNRLTSCLIVTRLESQAERLAQLAKEEDTFGKFILPAMGFPEHVVNGSRLAADLRYKFYQQDKGVVVYTPEIPAGGIITTSLANPAYFRIGKTADVSIWCDQGYAEKIPANNLKEVGIGVAR